MARTPAHGKALLAACGIVMALTLPAIAPPATAAGAASNAKDERAASAAATPPAAGRYAATLCVANATQPRSCGPAEAEVRDGGAVDVRVSDIVYRLATAGNAAVVVVTQGQMMIDAFDTGPQWVGHSLSFVDAEKQVRYELELGAPNPRRAGKP